VIRFRAKRETTQIKN